MNNTSFHPRLCTIGNRDCIYVLIDKNRNNDSHEWPKSSKCMSNVAGVVEAIEAELIPTGTGRKGIQVTSGCVLFKKHGFLGWSKKHDWVLCSTWNLEGRHVTLYHNELMRGIDCFRLSAFGINKL